MDFSLHGKVTARQAILDRERAVATARNPALSKYGSSLMAIGLKRNQNWSKQSEHLDYQMKRIDLEMRQKKKYFVKNCRVLNYDPIILVERTSSMVEDKSLSNYQNNDGNGDITNYENGKLSQDMMQLCSTSTLPTVQQTTTDAFTIQSKKKKNVWEECHEDLESIQFKSMVHPFKRLTTREQHSLQKGWSFHKPRLTPDQIIYSSYVQLRSATSRTPVKKMKAIDYLTSYEHFTVERIRNSVTEDTFSNIADGRSRICVKQNNSSKHSKCGESKNVRFTPSDTSI